MIDSDKFRYKARKVYDDNFCDPNALCDGILRLARDCYNEGLEDAAKIADGTGCILRGGCFAPSQEIADEARAKKVPT